MIMFLVMCKFLSILFLYSIHFLFIALSILFQNMLNLCYRNYREELREQEVTSEEQSECSHVKSNFPALCGAASAALSQGDRRRGEL